MRGVARAITRGQCLMAMYHYVRPQPTPQLPFFRAMDLKRFEKQVEALGKEWSFLSLDNYLEGIWGDKRLPEKSCVLTFDDGVRDHYDHVFPVLKRKGISGAFFISSRTISDSYLLDVHIVQHLVARLEPPDLFHRLEAAVQHAMPEGESWLASVDHVQADHIYHYEPLPEVRRAKYIMNFALPNEHRRSVVLLMFREVFGPEQEFAKGLYLTPDQLKEMAMNGMVIGSHGHEHRPMSACDEGLKQRELSLSKKFLQGWIGHGVNSFCYPWGGSAHIDDASEGALIAQGYRCGLTTLDGINEGEVNPFYLKRKDCINMVGGKP